MNLWFYTIILITRACLEVLHDVVGSRALEAAVDVVPGFAWGVCPILTRLVLPVALEQVVPMLEQSVLCCVESPCTRHRERQISLQYAQRERQISLQYAKRESDLPARGT